MVVVPTPVGCILPSAACGCPRGHAGTVGMLRYHPAGYRTPVLHISPCVLQDRLDWACSDDTEAQPATDELHVLKQAGQFRRLPAMDSRRSNVANAGTTISEG